MQSTGYRAAQRFEEACARFESGEGRGDVLVQTVDAPSAIAPHTAAWHAKIQSPSPAPGQGRLALAFDPDSPESWGGPFRVILFLTVPLDTAVAQDPLLAEVAWSWLTDALGENAPGSHSVAGTISKTFNTGFGALATHREGTVLELRASWTPLEAELGGCRTAWVQALALFAGLPPVAPEHGVTPLRGGFGEYV
ncbi:MAG: DUF3000 domain-containing protein [Microbacteriaceae bacterium]|nr:DUF3000 domain-containing protein [Microbacteriaceae bacterium]MCI1207260.1 DUF3000 domain-containing protein [Microbacteriaceae bacterium]